MPNALTRLPAYLVMGLALLGGLGELCSLQAWRMRERFLRRRRPAASS